jgi:hypothetical protein
VEGPRGVRDGVWPRGALPGFEKPRTVIISPRHHIVDIPTLSLRLFKKG